MPISVHMRLFDVIAINVVLSFSPTLRIGAVCEQNLVLSKHVTNISVQGRNMAIDVTVKGYDITHSRGQIITASCCLFCLQLIYELDDFLLL